MVHQQDQSEQKADKLSQLKTAAQRCLPLAGGGAYSGPWSIGLPPMRLLSSSWYALSNVSCASNLPRHSPMALDGEATLCWPSRAVAWRGRQQNPGAACRLPPGLLATVVTKRVTELKKNRKVAGEPERGQAPPPCSVLAIAVGR